MRVTMRSKGQALVEFTLVFVLLIIIAWIPADFGLAFYTGQLALNASREGARIAAADPDLLAKITPQTCAIPCASASDLHKAAADRISSALLPGATVTVQYPFSGSACNEVVRVSVQGQYNFFYYQLLRLVGVTVPDAVNVNRFTDMRWEHQVSCAPF